MNLPAVIPTDGNLEVVDPDTGEALPVTDASDRALAHAAHQVAELDRELFQAKRVLAAELRDRHGIGTTRTGGYEFKITESQSWPATATREALEALVVRGTITQADADRAMPAAPKPDGRALKALASRLAVTYPDAAQILAAACTTSPPSLRELKPLPEATAA